MADNSMKPHADHDGNEISTTGKWLAGILLTIFTIIPVYIIVSLWPDRLPLPNEDYKPLYINEPFRVRLACVPQDVCCADSVLIEIERPDTGKDTTQQSLAPDTLRADTVAGATPLVKPSGGSAKGPAYYPVKKLVHINTIILILVAAGGFTGNMIHIATSFTTFVGAGRFKSSWLLWYCVKPFTAAALAIAVYFIFRGGYLNASGDTVSINLFGAMTVAFLTGISTEKATEKLGELVGTLFGPKNAPPLPDPLLRALLKITGFKPAELVLHADNTIVITGENLDKQKLTIAIDDIPLAGATITSTTITAVFRVPEELQGKTQCTLTVSNEKGEKLFSGTINIAQG
jgi:hypothetical protein